MVLGTLEGNKKMKKTLLAVVLASLCGFANANDKITYDFVDAGYAAFKASDENVTFSGFVIEGSKLLSENVFVAGQWASVEDSFVLFNVPVNVDINQVKLSIGYRYGMAPATDMYGQFGYARQKLEASGSLNGMNTSESDSEDGFLVKLGLKHSFGRFEGGLFVERIDLGGDFEASTLVGVDGRLKFTENFHGVVSYAKDSDLAEYKIAASYAF